MELKATVIKVLPVQTGQKKDGSTWHKSEFVIDIQGDSQYPKILSLTMFGEKSCPRVGDNVKVSFDVESREYNGKYYTEAKCWKVETITQTATPSQPELPTGSVKDQFMAYGGQVNDDLPF